MTVSHFKNDTSCKAVVSLIVKETSPRSRSMPNPTHRKSRNRTRSVFNRQRNGRARNNT